MDKKIIFTIFLFLAILASAKAENCEDITILNTDCNMATQLINSSNNPVEDASCDANLTKPDNSIGFQSNQPYYWQDGIYLIESDQNFNQLGVYIFSIKCVSGGDTYFGSTEFKIVLSIGETPDPNNCEITIIAQRSKKGNYQIFSASGFDSTRNSLNLSPTIEIFDLDSGVKTINEESMLESESVAGLYNYYYNGVFLPSTYAIKVDFDENCSTTETFEVEETFREEEQVKEEQETSPNLLNTDNILFVVISVIVSIAIIIFAGVLYNKGKKGGIVP